MAYDQQALKKMVREIPDFPEEGVLFRDITTLLKNGDGLRGAVDAMEELMEGVPVDIVAGPESRGFVFGMPLAYNLHKGFVMIRKPGKLPAETISQTYDLEYGTSTIEMHKDAINPGQKVFIVDDLLATGGTAKAMINLIEEAGGVVSGLCFLIELKDLKGREKLEGYPVFSVLQY